MASTTIANDGRLSFSLQECLESGHQLGHLRRLSPITRLPAEALQHIFLHSIPPMSQPGFHRNDNLAMNFPFPEPDPAQPPLLLTRICSRWRDISLSAPELWCSLRLCIPYYTHYKGNGELLRVMLEAWLRNAQILPLNIALDIPERQSSVTSPPAPGSLWDHILPVFMSHAHHLSTLIASPAIAKYLLEHKVHMPMLKTFLSQDLVYFRSADVLRLAPRLLSLSVTTFDGRWLLPGRIAQGLQHLSLLCCDTPREVLTILAYFPRLLSFRLRACWSDEPGTQSVTHQTLEEFVVPHVMALRYVTNMLTLPSLRTMIITGNWDVSSMESIRSMLSRSSCSMQYLEFSGSMYHDVDHEMGYEAEQLFQFSPHIRVCHVDFERPTSSL